MAQAIISRKGGGGGAATLTFDNYGTSGIEYTGATDLSENKAYLAATTVGNYALFGGGETGNGTSHSGSSSKVDAYNTSLARITITDLQVPSEHLAATTVGNYALFGGGYNYVSGSGNIFNNYVNAYNTSLTRSTPTSLSQSRGFLAATTVGDYALFGGSSNAGIYLSTVDAYNTSLTRSTPTSLSVARGNLAATTVGDYALFGGGCSSSSIYSSTVDAYNTSLTRSTPTALSVARYQLAATTVGDYALFGGGYASLVRPYHSNVVDAYNTSLTRSVLTVLSDGGYGLSATSVGNYALFGGRDNGYRSTVDVYHLNSKIISIYPGTKYKLGDMADEATSQTFQEIEVATPINGYIKVSNTTIN